MAINKFTAVFLLFFSSNFYNYNYYNIFYYILFKKFENKIIVRVTDFHDNYFDEIGFEILDTTVNFVSKVFIHFASL